MTPGPQRLQIVTHILAVVAGVALYWFGVVQDIRIPIVADALYGFHLIGHLLGFWLPTTYSVMAGSFAQVLLPLGLAGYFLLFQQDFRGVSLMCALTSYSAHEVSTYVADAPLQLISIGPGHRVFDWAVALGPSGLNQLAAADELAWVVRVIAILAMLAGIGFGTWGAVRVFVERENTEKLDVYLNRSASMVREQARSRQDAVLREYGEYPGAPKASLLETEEHPVGSTE